MSTKAASYSVRTYVGWAAQWQMPTNVTASPGGQLPVLAAVEDERRTVRVGAEPMDRQQHHLVVAGSDFPFDRAVEPGARVVEQHGAVNCRMPREVGEPVDAARPGGG